MCIAGLRMRRRLSPLTWLACFSLLASAAAYGCSSSNDAAQDGGPDGPGPGGQDGGPDLDGSTAGDSASHDGDAGSFADADDDGGATADADAAPSGPLSDSYVDFDINHVLSTGQSNSVANGGGAPSLTQTQPYTNLMFDTGVMPMKGCDGNGCTQYDTPAAFAPLVETDKFFNYVVETASNGIADEISNLALQKYMFGTKAGYPTKHDVLVSLHGRSGNTYWCLRKNGCNYKPGYLKPFSQGLMEVASAKALAMAAGKSYIVRAVTTVHGESDHYSYTAGTQEFPLPGTDGVPGAIADYADGLIEWQRDYETDVKAITGQTQGIPLLVSQVSGWTDATISKVAQMELDAHIRAPGKVVLVTPAYPLDVRNDCLHFSATGQRRLGEYFAKAYAKIIFGGGTWEPVRPKTVSRAGNVITVQYFVPKPPLVFDTTRVTNPGNYGFTFLDGSGAPPTITNVALTAADTIQITLSGTPTGPTPRLRYAQNQPAPGTACIGPGTTYSGGARGNVRDSDDTPSQYGYDLFNWGVMFDVAAP